MEIETILRANLFLRPPRANNYRIYIFASTAYVGVVVKCFKGKPYSNRRRRLCHIFSVSFRF